MIANHDPFDQTPLRCLPAFFRSLQHSRVHSDESHRPVSPNASENKKPGKIAGFKCESPASVKHVIQMGDDPPDLVVSKKPSGTQVRYRD